MGDRKYNLVDVERVAARLIPVNRSKCLVPGTNPFIGCTYFDQDGSVRDVCWRNAGTAQNGTIVACQIADS